MSKASVNHSFRAENEDGSVVSVCGLLWGRFEPAPDSLDCKICARILHREAMPRRVRAATTQAGATLACLRALVEALPRGCMGPDNSFVECARPVTRRFSDETCPTCDEHGPDIPELSYAAALRAALALLGPGGVG